MTLLQIITNAHMDSNSGFQLANTLQIKRFFITVSSETSDW